MSRKISELIKSQAHYMFNQKKEQIIHNAIKNIANRTGRRFEDVLAVYMNNN